MHAALGLDIRLEGTSNHGRIDMTVLFNSSVYLFELKLVELIAEGKALQQIQERGGFRGAAGQVACCCT
ncbi:hypothetical protein D3C72_2195480 [compost metagenome]